MALKGTPVIVVDEGGLPVNPVEAGGPLLTVAENGIGATISQSGDSRYRYYGNNVYWTTGAGTCGATPPTHTSGTESDGNLDWTYIWTAEPTHAPSRNYIDGNIVFPDAASVYANRVTAINRQSQAPQSMEWTTAARPDAAAYRGMMGLNSTTGLIELSNGTAWVSPSVP